MLFIMWLFFVTFMAVYLVRSVAFLGRFPVRVKQVINPPLNAQMKKSASDLKINPFMYEFQCIVKEVLSNANLKDIIIRENKLLNVKTMNRTGNDALREVQVRPLLNQEKSPSLQLRYKYLRSDSFKNENIYSLLDNVIPSLIKETGFYRININCHNGTQYFFKVKRNPDHSIFSLEYKAVDSKGDSKVSPISESVPRMPELSFENNRKKVHLIPENVRFLEKLGISRNVSSGRSLVVDTMQFKYKQINNFVRIFEQSFLKICEQFKIDTSTWHGLHGVEIVDVGCGKAYLTFALQYYLRTRIPDIRVTIQTIGIDFDPGLIQHNQAIVDELGPPFHELSFQTGTIQDTAKILSSSKLFSKIDNSAEGKVIRILVALHACNTATDDALFCGMVEYPMDLILVAPCCHKEIRPQLDRFINKNHRKQKSTSELPHLKEDESTRLWQFQRGDAKISKQSRNAATDTTSFTSTESIPPLLLPLLEHGIYRERFSEILTDSIRAKLLSDIGGFRTKIMEFVDKENAGKNTLLIANKEYSPDHAISLASLQEINNTLMKAYGISQQRLFERLFANVVVTQA